MSSFWRWLFAPATAVQPLGSSGRLEDKIDELRADVREIKSTEIKCLEIRDSMTFIPVICVRPVPSNEAQRYLLRRDGYRGSADERCVIYINAQCRGVAYDCYDWPANPRTHRVAHDYIAKHWHELDDGEVIDVEFIVGETTTKKISERFGEFSAP